MTSRETERTGLNTRDPSAFRDTDHLQDSLDDEMRFVTRDRLNQTIRDGRDRTDRGDAGTFHRMLRFDGVDVVAVLSRTEPVVVTAWTEIGDWTAALRSDMWSYEDLSKIRAFEDREHRR